HSPPSPTLFPYTTLFRSLAGQAHVFAHDLSTPTIEISAFPSDRHEFNFLVSVLLKKGLGRFQQVGIERAAKTFVGGYEDDQIARSESTRLNSSHVSISYA